MAFEPTADVDRRLAGLDDSLRELRDRIEALRCSVTDLDRPAASLPPAAAPASPEPPSPSPEAPAPPASPEADDLVARLRGLLDELKGVTAPEAPTAPPEPPPPHQPAAAPPAEPAPPVWTYQPPPRPQHEPPPEPPPPGPTPDGTHPRSRPTAKVAAIDAGPFTDLIALRSFEESLMSLPGIQDLRVRRFSQERAQIQLLLAGPIAVEGELARLGHGIEVQPGAEGIVRVELPRQAWPHPPAAAATDEPS